MNYESNRIKRYREILAVFAKHGFGLLFRRVSPRRDSVKGTGGAFHTGITPGGASKGKRLRLALEELGPAFVKLGQLLSVRRDMFPADLIEELGKLQDSVQPFPFSEAKALIEGEFNEKLVDIYQEFDEEPVAAASVAQVHRARLLSGKQVAVKVQRPQIEDIIRLDLDILKDMARWMDRHTKYGEFYDFSGMVADFENTILSELDFTKEGENADLFRQNFRKDEGVIVPRVRWIHTTKRVLTMEYIEGIKISDNDALDRAGIDRKLAAERLASSVCNQILRDGFFHADPHPGNIQVLPDNTIVFLDLGMVGRLSEARKSAAIDFFIGIVFRDSRMVVDAIADMGAMTADSNIKEFEKDIGALIEEYLTMPMNEIRLDEMVHRISQIIYANRIKTPHEFALVAKTLGVLQGLLEKLDPGTNALAVAEPIAEKLMYQSLSPQKTKGRIKKDLLEYRRLLSDFPGVIRHILRKTEDEDFAVPFEMKEADKIQNRMERISNRITFGMILLAVSVILAGALIGSGLSANTGGEAYLLNASVVKAGLALAILIVIGLVISMTRPKR